LAARRKPERYNPRVPVRVLGNRLVLLGVPECTVVAGVDPNRRVITPAIERVLRSAADNGKRLRLKQARLVASFPPRKPNRRIRRAAGDAVADADVAGLVHRDAAHPPVLRAAPIPSLPVDR